MQRTRLFDIRISRMNQIIGKCKDDLPSLADAVNSAQRRLLMAREAGDESWWGTWAEIAFNVSRATPYITLPREVARLESINVCERPVAVQNQFFEYLQFGNGRLPKTFRQCGTGHRPLQILTRNQTPTFIDLTGTPRFLAAYMTEAQDAGKRVLFQGTDANNQVIYTQDTFQRVKGVFVSLDSPFVTAPTQFNSITGIQKDFTAGNVHIFEINPQTGVQTALLTMEPSETTAWYRRYYLDALPRGCCPPAAPTPCDSVSNSPVQVTAIAKLDLIPVVTDSDYLLIQNIEAVIQEAAAVRYSMMDTSEAKKMELYHHKNAIGLLQGELTHYIGTQEPAISFAPFGTARLEKKWIGILQ